jgi:hypothetical protein
VFTSSEEFHNELKPHSGSKRRWSGGVLDSNPQNWLPLTTLWKVRSMRSMCSMWWNVEICRLLCRRYFSQFVCDREFQWLTHPTMGNRDDKLMGKMFLEKFDAMHRARWASYLVKPQVLLNKRSGSLSKSFSKNLSNKLCLSWYNFRSDSRDLGGPPFYVLITTFSWSKFPIVVGFD